jgi:hypothetical protein
VGFILLSNLTFFRYIRSRFVPFLPFPSGSSSVSYSEYPSSLFPTLIDVATTSTHSADHDLNDPNEGTEEPQVNASASFGGESDDSRGRGRQHSSGERILRFSPTISVKYFDTQKKASRSDPNRKRDQNSIPPSVQQIMSEESKADNPITLAVALPPEVTDV